MLPFLVFYTWAYFWPNCLISSKFSFVNTTSWLFQEAEEHYQVTFVASVKRRKVGSPFRLSLFLPWFWHFKLFLWLWRTSQQYKPTPKKVKDGPNLLFRRHIIANTHASSMRSRVSYRFQIDSSYMCGRAKTMRKCYEWTRFFLENGGKKLRFQTNTDTCGQGLRENVENWQDDKTKFITIQSLPTKIDLQKNCVENQPRGT